MRADFLARLGRSEDARKAYETVLSLGPAPAEELWIRRKLLMLESETGEALMHWPTALFVAAVVAATAVELWLAARQIAAVEAHRDRVPEPFTGQLSPADHHKAADYTVAKIGLGRIGALIHSGLTLLLTVGGGIAAIDALWRRAGWGEPWLGIAVIATVAAVIGVVGLPLSLWRTFRLEARFGFNRTTPKIFLADLAKGLALAVLIGGPLTLAVLVLMDRAGRWWWLAAFACWLAATLLITWAWPAFIAPLFNRFSPLQDAALEERIEALLARCGFRSSGVFVIDGSRRSAHGNAYFTGIGRHKRIVFFDTLLNQLGASEIEAVLAHELGHFRLRHVRQRLIVSFATMLAGFALLGWLTARPAFYEVLGVPTPSPHAALLLFALAGPVALFFTTPLGSLWSRRHEFAADRFASEHASARELASALVKLYRDNASTLTPDPLYTAFYYSHPPALERIGRLTGASTAG
ncbi:MAG TPA: M48 family metalloprotease [Steroidobacteraceae bacterium]|nr:M48 family metalloprotease [Steroidobacteraceae bacterium]